MNVAYENFNGVWVWDADGDGYFEGRTARVDDAAVATGLTVAALLEIQRIEKSFAYDDGVQV